MNYQQWRARRDELIDRYQPLRLDCMNPFYALDHIRLQHVENSDPVRRIDTVVQAWSDCAGVELDMGTWFVTRGVRSFLRTLCCAIGKSDKTGLWMPSDVFPTYHTIAADARIIPESFTVMPSPDFRPLEHAGPNDVLVLPLPLTPIGRSLAEPETDGIVGWLRQSPARTVVIDTVYAYKASGYEGLDRLIETGQCIQAWSISKTWIQRQVFGVAIVPDAWASVLASPCDAPSDEDIHRAIACFTQQPDLPRKQQERFEAQWEMLRPEIVKVCPKWTPPETGYFSILPMASQALLDNYGMLAVPASVFGSRRDDLSVISCLHDIYP